MCKIVTFRHRLYPVTFYHRQLHVHRNSSSSSSNKQATRNVFIENPGEMVVVVLPTEAATTMKWIAVTITTTAMLIYTA
jgi:hypothetical protein